MGAEHVVVGGYVGCLVLLLVFSLSQAHLALVRRRARPGHVASGATNATLEPRPPTPTHWPTVTVQLPIYNERHVSKRLIDAAAALDYPRDRLVVQVLDDSTDDTAGVIDAAVGRHRGAGVDIKVVRRSTREGYKAGALAHGLCDDTSELVAILDADFVPGPDLLRRLVPHFDSPDVAAVQARWGYLNPRESLTTRVEAFLLDLHFAVEQPARAATGGFLNFNGTAGIWRRSAIEDAGGWLARTVTEDIDLSYRAQLRGWRIAYVEACAVPSELPADMGALRSQQHRWIKGGAQNARLHLSSILALPGIRPRHRWHAAAHLLSGTTYAVILLMLLLTVPLAAVKNTAITTDYVDFGLPFCAATLALGWTMAVAQAPRGWRGWAGFAGLLAAFLVFTMGLAVHNGAAALSGWFGRPGGAFVRTPKSGGDGWQCSAYAVRSVDRRVLGEVAVLAWLGLGLAIAWWRREPALVPIQLMGCAGLVWVLALSLHHPLRARRAATVAGRHTGQRPGEQTAGKPETQEVPS